MKDEYSFEVESDIDDLTHELVKLQASYGANPTAVTAALISCYLSRLAGHSESQSMQLCWKAEKYWEAKALSTAFNWADGNQLGS